MREKYLVINAGSSSLKFSLYEIPSMNVLISGYFEKIGKDDSFYTIKIDGNKIKREVYLSSHKEAVDKMIEELLSDDVIYSMDEIMGIGHRILHGGDKYFESVLINDEVIDDITNLIKLGPLHHPGQIASIKAIMEVLPSVKQVAVFDTAFHQSMPDVNYLYPVPIEWYNNYKVRKYGFHGTSHRYLTEYMKKELNKDKVNLIICHVGSGASISCIKDSKCYDTSMGLTPLDGLMMGTRCGNIDSSIIKYVMDEGGMDIDNVMNMLNNKSGLFGICGENDFRDVIKMMGDDNEGAELAYKMFLNSIIKYIGQYYFMLDGIVDAIVFSAGVLENNIMFRRDLVNKLSNTLNIKINDSVNENIGAGKNNDRGIITDIESKIPIYVIPTNEEEMILRDTYNVIRK